MAVVSALLVVGVVAFGVLIVQDFNGALEPELERRSDLIGTTVRDDTERALGLGIPLDSLVGTEQYFEALLEDFPELDYVAIRDGRDGILFSGGSVPDAARDPGVVVARVGSTALGDSLVRRYSLIAEGVIVGSVDVGVEAGFVRSRLEDLALDIAVILVVALVVAYELALAIGDRVVRGRSRRRALTGVADVRIVLFIFVVGEELSKSFLPQFILSVYDPLSGLDPALAVSLPIMAYLLTLALASPFAGRLSVGLGERRLLLVGMGVAAVSHLGMVVATDLSQVMALRALTGVGYALATIACLEYLIDRSPGTSRARTMGAFVAVVIGGTFAGTALGGILADRLGYRPVFAVSVVFVVAAAVLAWRMMSARRPQNAAARSQSVSRRDIFAVLHRPRLVALLAGVTVPMNVLLAAFLWYLVPLTLTAVGSGAAEVARALMLYYLAVLLAAPLVARVAEGPHRPWLLAGVGSVLSGAILLLPAMEPTTLTISLAVLIVGIGHGAVRGPQLTLALEIAEDDAGGDNGAGRGATLAAMRTLERLGSLAGLLVAALVAARFDLLVAMAVVGIAAAVAGCAYLAYQWRARGAVQRG